MTLKAEQAAAKAHYDALKARHPFPGGWREDNSSTEKENAAARTARRLLPQRPDEACLKDWNEAIAPGCPLQAGTQEFKGETYAQTRLLHALVDYPGHISSIYQFCELRSLRKVRDGFHVYFHVEEFMAAWNARVVKR